LFPSWSG